MVCQFSEVCKYYHSNAATCQDEREASRYCGAYLVFVQVKGGVRKKEGLDYGE